MADDKMKTLVLKNRSNKIWKDYKAQYLNFEKKCKTKDERCSLAQFTRMAKGLIIADYVEYYQEKGDLKGVLFSRRILLEWSKEVFGREINKESATYLSDMTTSFVKPHNFEPSFLSFTDKMHFVGNAEWKAHIKDYMDTTIGREVNSLGKKQ